jgi:hypothetical protein
VAVVIDIRSMRDDLKSFGRATKTFIQNSQRLLQLEAQLSNAASVAKRGDRQLQWSTDIGDGGAIRSVPSDSYRNAGGHKFMVAEVSFTFSGFLQEGDENRFVIKFGGTRVKLCWDGSDGESLYHFDIHPDEAGHPMLHVQFDGPIGELPRLHTIFAHPLDVLEFTLMEVFQKRWRESRVDMKFASEIRKYPVNQRKRIIALLGSYKEWLDSDDHALIALLTFPGAPLDLYPS